LRLVTAHVRILLQHNDEKIKMEDGKCYEITKGKTFRIENKSTLKPATLVIYVSKKKR